jgi:hypothetical protein
MLTQDHTPDHSPDLERIDLLDPANWDPFDIDIDEAAPSDEDIARLIAADPATTPVALDEETCEIVGAPTDIFPLASWDTLKDLPEPEWIIAKVLPADSFGAVVGEPKNGKTFLNLELALHIAAGLPWRGFEVKQGHVIYSIGEGQRGFANRIRAWLSRNPSAEADVTRYFHVVLRAVPVLQAPEAARLMRTAKHLHGLNGKPLRYVTIDTMARAIGGDGDENSAGDMQRAVQTLEAVARDTGCATSYVHHLNKNGGVRGSSALVGSVDFMIKATRGEAPANSVLTISCEEMKDGERWPSYQAQLTVLPEIGSCVLTDLGLAGTDGASAMTGAPIARSYYNKNGGMF